MSSEEQHATAVLAALNAALAAAPFNGSVTAYDLDDLAEQQPKPTEYVEVTIHRRYSESSRACTDKGVDLWRVTTRYVARASVTTARNLRDATRTTLEQARLTVGAATTTPVQFETAVPIEQDSEHWYSGLDSWTYAH